MSMSMSMPRAFGAGLLAFDYRSLEIPGRWKSPVARLFPVNTRDLQSPVRYAIYLRVQQSCMIGIGSGTGP